MNASPQPQPYESFDFRKFLIISVAAHFTICILLFFKAVFFPSEPIEIRSAIRVDVVDLPDKVKAPTPPKAAPKPKAVQVKKTKSKKPKTKTVNLKRTKKKQQSAFDKLKAMDAIEKLKNEAAKSEKKLAKKPEPTQFKGNAITSGSSLTGLDRIAFEKYFDDMKNHVHQHWDLPAWLANAQLKNQVIVKIDERGYVIDRKLHQTSNNDVFDNLALETVDRASPFPEPPMRLKNVLALKGFVLGFPE